MSALRSENFLLDQAIYELKENLLIEHKIHNNNAIIPKEIQNLSIHDLRSHLLSASQE